MKFSTTLLPITLVAGASFAQAHSDFYRSSNGIVRRACSGSKHRSRKHSSSHVSQSEDGSTPASQTSDATVKIAAAVVVSSSTSSAEDVEATAASYSSKTTSSAASQSTSSSGSSGSGGKGLFGVSDATCGASGAQEGSSSQGGPNGNESWLSCGLSSSNKDSGWTPPKVSIDAIKAISLEEALAMDDSIFGNCADYVSIFEKYGAQLDIPPILLASLAMQESSCRADVLGDNGGAFGLMQITADKCGDAPSGNCADPEYNIKTAANYFASTLASYNGDLLQALGTYNGWYSGMTYNNAIAIKGSCCACQQNLDYMQQLLNGWLQGLDGSKMGTFRNLDSC